MQGSGKSRRRCPTDVFRYMDYRHFLADFYRAKKRRNFSYRAFSRRAGLGAPNYLKLVIDGDRNLTPAMAKRFADACDLGGEGADYFCTLVAFNQSDNNAERNRSYARLTGFRRYRRAQRLELAQAAYHSTWYLPAIRELVRSPGFRNDPDWIASVLWPRIKPAEARRGVETLIELGMLEADADGRIVQTQAVVSTGAQTQGMHITNYHREMMRRATDAMELVPAAERDISSLTVCLGPQGIERLKQRIQDFRRELVEFAEAETDTTRDQVVQLNLQLFPLTQHVSTDAPEA